MAQIDEFVAPSDALYFPAPQLVQLDELTEPSSELNLPPAQFVQIARPELAANFPNAQKPQSLSSS